MMSILNIKFSVSYDSYHHHRFPMFKHFKLPQSSIIVLILLAIIDFALTITVILNRRNLSFHVALVQIIKADFNRIAGGSLILTLT